MTERIAKPVVKNKFWVVEDHGQKIATIQARDDGGFVYVHDEQREYFSNVKNIKQKYDIKFSNLERSKKDNSKTVYDYPVTGKTFNQVWDVQRRLPIYSKTAKSKSLYCAGYYLIKINSVWTEAFCPKNITLNRYAFIGPFQNKQQMHDTFQEIKCKD
jgi:hypothetical protein